MKIVFVADGGRDTPVRTCELCLQPMKFLGDHAEYRLFRCESCALVSTEDTEPHSGVRSPGASAWAFHH